MCFSICGSGARTSMAARRSVSLLRRRTGGRANPLSPHAAAGRVTRRGTRRRGSYRRRHAVPRARGTGATAAPRLRLRAPHPVQGGPAHLLPAGSRRPSARGRGRASGDRAPREAAAAASPRRAPTAAKRSRAARRTGTDSSGPA